MSPLLCPYIIGSDGAAAGTPNAVFMLALGDLQTLAQGQVAAVKA